MSEPAAFLAAGFSFAVLVATLEILAIGQPPRHCHYLVPVKSAPGVYACSQYPRPLTKP